MKKLLSLLSGALLLFLLSVPASAKDTSSCQCGLENPVAVIKTQQGQVLATVPYDQQPHTLSLPLADIQGKNLVVEFTYQYQHNPFCSMMGPHASASDFIAAEDVRALFSLNGGEKQPLSAFQLPLTDTHMELDLQLGFDDTYYDPNYFGHQYLFDLTFTNQAATPSPTPAVTPSPTDTGSETPRPTLPPSGPSPSLAPQASAPTPSAHPSTVPKTGDPVSLLVLAGGAAVGLVGIGLSKKRPR